MARNRYVRDYELTEEVKDKGRIRQKVRYVGQAYVFSASREERSRVKTAGLVRCAFGWLCYAGAMVLPSKAMHNLFVSLSFVAAAVPWFLLSGCIAAFRKMEEPLERRQADLMNNRYPAASLFAVFFTAGALLGEAFLAVSGGRLLPGDAVFMLCGCGLLAAGGRAFADRKTVQAVPEQS